jgi:hypothetical protein
LHSETVFFASLVLAKNIKSWHFWHKPELFRVTLKLNEKAISKRNKLLKIFEKFEKVDLGTQNGENKHFLQYLGI